MLSSLIKKLRLIGINIGLIKSTFISIRGRKIKFENIKESNLLKEIAVNGQNSYEPELVNLIQHYPFQIRTFIDGGANIGFYSIIGAISLPDEIDIIAVEPFPKNISYIKKIIENNKLKFTVLDRALHNESGKTVTLYYPDAKSSSRLSTSASLINSFEGTKGIYSNLPANKVSVKTITLEDVLESKKYPALIKLDCEGNELSILTGSEKLLEHNDIDFIIEIMINDRDKNDVFNMMKKYSFDAYLITNAGLIREDRPLTLPYFNINDRTCWKNHYFTKRPINEIKKFSINVYNNWI